MKLAVDHLPPSARLLVELIGLPKTLVLVQHYAGQRFHPPQSGPEYAALAEVVGEAAATKLAATFRRQPLNVPKCVEAIRAVVHSELRADFDRLTSPAEGLTARRAVSALVRRYGYVDRHVWRLLKMSDAGGTVAETKQGSLF